MSKENSRWSYANGSRPEGVILYDDHPNGGSLKLHSWHDTDPAGGGGQVNAFDLCRVHMFSALDSTADKAKPITERPSYKAMCQLALEQPELREKNAASDFAALGDLGPLTEKETIKHGTQALARRICDVLNTPTTPDWLIEDTLERQVIAILAGPRGSFKSFIALDWAARIALSGDEVYVVSAEGGDFDRRFRAWLMKHAPEVKAEQVPLYLVERRIDMSVQTGVELIRQDCVNLGIRPKLFVLDTFSKLSGALEENDNTAVKQFIGHLDSGLKRSFDASCLLICHTGHGNSARARGASALAADTDAEYIVSRAPGTETVSVTRERFKSSSELPPLYYAAEVVQLGRADKRGKPVTSLALTKAEAPPTPKGGRKLSDTQRPLYDLVKMMEAGTSVAIEDVVEGFKRTQPKSSEGRDNRGRKANRAIESLVANGWLFLVGEDRVSTLAIQPGVDDAFEYAQ